MSFRICSPTFIILLLFFRLQIGACNCSRMKFHRAAEAVPGPPSALGYESVDTEITRRPTSTQKTKFSANEFKSCLPKGFRPPPSAPSHFGNSHALDSFTLCSSSEDIVSKP